jgi:hypothetical protein
LSGRLVFPRLIDYSGSKDIFMRKIAALCIAALLLSSCVAVDSKLSIKDDGSGTLTLSYRVSQLVVDLGDSSSDKSAVPLPLTRADFERSLEASKGKVRLAQFDRSETEKDIVIHAELSFESLEALGQVPAFHDEQITAVTAGSRHTLSQVIARAPATAVNDDSLRMVDAFFDGYDLTFTIEAPGPIHDNTLGTLSADKKVLTYTTSIKEIMRAKSDVVLSLGW